jgi:hypothetical protein
MKNLLILTSAAIVLVFWGCDSNNNNTPPAPTTDTVMLGYVLGAHRADYIIQTQKLVQAGKIYNENGNLHYNLNLPSGILVMVIGSKFYHDTLIAITLLSKHLMGTAGYGAIDKEIETLLENKYSQNYKREAITGSTLSYNSYCYRNPTTRIAQISSFLNDPPILGIEYRHNQLHNRMEREAEKEKANTLKETEKDF